VTFFVTGYWVEKYAEDVKAIAIEGHDIANNSENHKQMSQLNREQCIQEIMKLHERVKGITGKEMILFRPPYGDYNNTVIAAARDCQYYCIQWDVDSLDWKDYGVECIVDTVVNHKHLGNGSIILCHNGAKYTKDALEAMITGLQDKGYQILPISELIYTCDYNMNHEGRQFQKK
jgi:peptidoglycan-N-acetylglucosamine deacetylase